MSTFLQPLYVIFNQSRKKLYHIFLEVASIF